MATSFAPAVSAGPEPWASGAPAAGPRAGAQTVERPWSPRPGPVWTPPPNYDPKGDAEFRRAQRRLQLRRALIAIGIATLAVVLLIALVVMFSASDTAKTRAGQTPGSRTGGATDTNNSVAGTGALPTLAPATAGPLAGQPPSGTTAPANPTTTVAPASAATTVPASPAARSNTPAQPIGVTQRTVAQSPAQYPSVTTAVTKTVTVQEDARSSFFLPAEGQGSVVYPGTITFAASGRCASSKASIFITDQQNSNRSADLGPLSSPKTYTAATIGRYLVSFVGVNSEGSCPVSVTYHTR